jgi:hypothetical protein
MKVDSYKHRGLKHVCIKVQLNAEEWAHASEVGRKRNAMQRRYGKADGMTLIEDSLESDIQGAIGEMAAGFALNKHWDGEFFRTDEIWLHWRAHGTDLEGGIEVKSIDALHKGLLIQLHERYKPEHPYVLVIVEEVSKTCHILGWMYGVEVKQEIHLKTAFTTPAVPRDCYIADQDHLTSVEKLIKKIGGTMPPDVSDEYATYL